MPALLLGVGAGTVLSDVPTGQEQAHAVAVAVVAAVVVAVRSSGAAAVGRLQVIGASVSGVLQAAGLLFFAFAGYARIATLGAEVRDPARTIRRAIPLALAITLAVYIVVAVTALAALGPQRLADEGRPARLIPVVGLIGCVALAFALPLASVITGAAVLGVGILAYAVRRAPARRRLRRARTGHGAQA